MTRGCNDPASGALRSRLRQPHRAWTHCAGPAACGIINRSMNPAKPKPEAAMNKCSLVALVVPGVPLRTAASARDGLLVRNRAGHP